MAQVFFIVDVSGWRMGQDDVQPLAYPQLRAEPPNDPLHVLFTILLGPPVVPPRPFQPEQPDPLESKELGVKIGAPLGGLWLVAYVMISFDIETGSMKRIRQERQVFRRQVPAGKNQVDPGKSLRVELCGKNRLDPI